MSLLPRRGSAIVPLLAVLLLLIGCGDNEVNLDPPDVTYGEDTSEMGMFVVDPRYTVATLPEENNEWILFDDIGEVLKYRDRFPDESFRAIWVNDFHTEDWIAAEDAWYLQSDGFISPMGWKVAAFASKDEAEAFQAEHGGELMSWDAANDIEWTDPPAPGDQLD